MSARSEEIRKSQMQKAEAISAYLPSFVHGYIVSRSSSALPSTTLQYLYEIRRFLAYWRTLVPDLKTKHMVDITTEDLNNVTTQDISEYLYFLRAAGITNGNTQARVYAALGNLFRYLYNAGSIDANPFDRLDCPKTPNDQTIVTLSEQEIMSILSVIEHGAPAVSAHQQSYLRKTKERDYALFVLMLGTGVRVSEVCALNINDYDPSRHSVSVVRKGNKIQNVYLSADAEAAVLAYLDHRKALGISEDTAGNAVFLSIQNTRLTPLSVQQLVSKYAQIAGIKQRITPHKLRKTFGTALYNETSDIRLVAAALGHSNLNTTNKHYVATTDTKLADNRNAVGYLTASPEKEKDTDVETGVNDDCVF